MPSPRPYWKGYLKLSLVSCPIKIHAATSTSERVSFRQINKATGNRLRQQLVDEDTGDVVEAADKGRGYEVGRHEYMIVEDDELDAISIERARLDGIVATRCPVPGLKVAGAVWVSPDLRAEIAYRGLTTVGELRHASFKGLID